MGVGIKGSDGPVVDEGSCDRHVELNLPAKRKEFLLKPFGQIFGSAPRQLGIALNEIGIGQKVIETAGFWLYEVEEEILDLQRGEGVGPFLDRGSPEDLFLGKIIAPAHRGFEETRHFGDGRRVFEVLFDFRTLRQGKDQFFDPPLVTRGCLRELFFKFPEIFVGVNGLVPGRRGI